MKSLEGQLHLGLTLSLTLLIGGVWWLGHLALHRTADAFVLSRLQHDADALAAGLDPTPDPGGGPPGLALGPRTAALAIYEHPHSGHYYVIRPDRGEPLRSGGTTWSCRLWPRARPATGARRAPSGRTCSFGPGPTSGKGGDSPSPPPKT